LNPFQGKLLSPLFRTKIKQDKQDWEKEECKGTGLLGISDGKNKLQAAAAAGGS